MPLCRSFRRRTRVAFVLFVLGLGGLGCNVFDGLGPSPTGVEDLLTDARIAMTNGNPQRAVQLLETAFETDSTSVEVRVELANALYAAHDVDLFAVRAAVEHLNGKGAGGTTSESSRAACTDEAAPAPPPNRFRAVSFRDSNGLRTLLARQEQLQRVRRLVVDGVLGRRAEAFAEGAARTRGEGLLLAALTRLGRHLLGVREALQDAGGALYVDQESDPPGALVACGPTTEDRKQVERSLCRHEKGVSQAVRWLERRNELLSSEQTSLLLNLLRAHREALRTRLPCSAFGNTDTGDVGSQRPPTE